MANIQIQETINAIVANRKSRKEHYLAEYQKIGEIRDFCEKIKEWYSDSDWKYYYSHISESESIKSTLPGLESQCQDLLNKISGLMSDDSSNMGNLDIVINRINRGEFNICFMGAWRQGKSLIQQKLLELDDYVMPVHNGGACTGTVVSVSNCEDGKYAARVHYYSVKRIIEIINQYFAELGMSERLKVPNLSKEEFKSECAEIEHNMTKPMSATENSVKAEYYETLKNYIVHAPEYYKSLGNSSESRSLIDSNGNMDIENLEWLRKKIAFYDINQNPVYEVLAVEHVDVSKHFLIDGQEVGNVKITDTAGIGERRIGVDDELKRVLLRDTDVAIGVAMSTPTKLIIGDDVCHFHDTIKLTIGSLNPSKWFYYAINQGLDTYEHADAYKRKIKEQLDNINFVLPDRNLQVLQPMNPSETSGFLLNKILIPIKNNTADVDEVLFEATDKEIDEVKRLFVTFKQSLWGITCPEFNATQIKRKKIVSEIFNEIRSSLQNLTNKISSAEFDDPELQTLQEDIDDIFSSPEGYELTKMFFPKEIDIAESKNGDIEKNLIRCIEEHRQSITERLRHQITSKINFTGDELSVFVIYRQKMIESFYNNLATINSDHVTNSLKVVKEMIADEFVKYGKLSPELLSPNSDNFYSAIITRATKEGLPKLADFFIKLKDEEIKYMATLLDEIKNKTLVASKFSVSFNYKYDAKEIANQFYVSLLKLEETIKQELYAFFTDQSLVYTIRAHYYNMVGEIEGKLLISPDSYNDLFEEFIQLYQKLYSKLYNSEDFTRQENGYKKWEATKNRILKMN